MHPQCRGSRREPQVTVRLLQRYLRVAELEMRAAEGCLRSRPGRAQSAKLKRIGELEEREREREEIQAELVPAMESKGVRYGGVEGGDERLNQR
jgi:hypothetical protein